MVIESQRLVLKRPLFKGMCVGFSGLDVSVVGNCNGFLCIDRDLCHGSRITTSCFKTPLTGDDQHPFLVLEFMKLGALSKMLRSRRTLEWKIRLRFALDVANGIVNVGGSCVLY